MKLTKKNCPVKVKSGEDFKIFKAIVDGYNVNGISILHPDTMGMEGQEIHEFMDEFFKTTPEWRNDASLVNRDSGGKTITFIQIHADLEDTAY